MQNIGLEMLDQSRNINSVLFEVSEDDEIGNIRDRKKKMLLCPDQCVGTMRIKDNKISEVDMWFSKDKREENKEKTIIDKIRNKIVIVLESPHTDEYDYTIFGLPVPAIGQSGENLQNNFCNLLKVCIDENTGTFKNDLYDILIVNSIQYQCSLGVSTEYYRDRLWLKLWFDYKFEEDFFQRLVSYEPKIIINLCTEGDHMGDKYLENLGELYSEKEKITKKYLEMIKIKNIPENFKNTKLNNLVQKKIDEIENCICFTSRHPCNWRIPTFKKVVKI